MTLRSVVGAALCLAISASAAPGSQELVVPLSSFTLESGVLPSGPIKVSGTQSETGLIRLVIEAFGRQFELDQKHLQRLGGTPFSGVELTYEGAGRQLDLTEEQLKRLEGETLDGVDLNVLVASGAVLYVVFRRGVVEQRVVVSEKGELGVTNRAPAVDSVK